MKKRMMGLMMMPLLIFAAADNGGVVTIQNGGTEVGVLADVGGRVVILRRTGGVNLLRANPGLWNEPVQKRPVPDALAPSMKPYFGQIVWIGPQSDWWTQQDVNAALRDQSSQWPPDPYMIYGKFEIIARSDTSLLLQGPESPVSGLQLTKEIRVDGKGRVLFQVSAVNIRETGVEWDLWCNMRLPGISRCYVPVRDSADVRVDYQNGGNGAIRWEIQDGYFTFIPDLPKEKRLSAKAFIYPERGFIAGFQSDQMVLIRFSKLEKSEVHPQQGHVEIYSDLVSEPSGTLLELEHHGAYQRIPPGGSLSTAEVWELYPYQGENNPQAHTGFLDAILSRQQTVQPDSGE